MNDISIAILHTVNVLIRSRQSYSYDGWWQAGTPCSLMFLPSTQVNFEPKFPSAQVAKVKSQYVLNNKNVNIVNISPGIKHLPH